MEQERTIYELLEYRSRKAPDFIFGIYNDWQISYGVLKASVNRLASGLAKVGVKPGQRVAVMLRNHPDHIFTMFAISQLGAVWVPINVNLQGLSLQFVFQKSVPSAAIVDVEFWNRLAPILDRRSVKTVIVRNASDGANSSCGIEALDFTEVSKREGVPPAPPATLDEVRSISFTSGTTGEPKGVLLTERMLMTFAKGAAIASDAQPNDVFLLWEPLYHNSGAQMCILSLMEQIRLVILEKFSASQYWDQARKYRATKMHYLGGIIDILLKRPPNPKDKDHCIQLAFGGGCSKNNWRAFEKRFGVNICECYGMTEASGFTMTNKSGKLGSIGKPYPYFEVKIVDEEGKSLGVGQTGEIVVREKEPGVITQGYLENAEATGEALRGGWLYTGDLGSYDEEGDFYFRGRKKDSIRRRGENISAWEVERVLNSHPEIEESAVIGVETDVGEQDLKAFIKCTEGVTLEPLEIIKWCEPQMPYYQIPRYLTFLASFEKTPSERIRKKPLSKDTTKCWDLEKSGYRIERK